MSTPKPPTATKAIKPPKPPKRQSITINNLIPTHQSIASALNGLTSRELRDLCKLHGAPIQKLKKDTAVHLANRINEPERKLVATLTLRFFQS